MEEFFDEDYFYGNKKSNYENYDELKPENYFKDVINFIKVLQKGGKYLDVGCAFGYLIREVLPFFDETYGCDVSKYAIERARKVVPASELKVMDLDQTFLYPKEYFNVVTALDILEHTRNLDENFMKVSASVKRGGYLIVSLPIDSWPRKLFGFLDKDKSHISISTESDLIKVVKKNGFVILKKNYFAPAPFFIKIRNIPAEMELFLQKIH